MTITTLGNIIYYWKFFFLVVTVGKGKIPGTTLIKCKQRLYVMYRVGQTWINQYSNNNKTFCNVPDFGTALSGKSEPGGTAENLSYH